MERGAKVKPKRHKRQPNKGQAKDRSAYMKLVEQGEEEEVNYKELVGKFIGRGVTLPTRKYIPGKKSWTFYTRRRRARLYASGLTAKGTPRKI